MMPVYECGAWGAIFFVVYVYVVVLILEYMHIINTRFFSWGTNAVPLSM